MWIQLQDTWFILSNADEDNYNDKNIINIAFQKLLVNEVFHKQTDGFKKVLQVKQYFTNTFFVNIMQ